MTTGITERFKGKIAAAQATLADFRMKVNTPITAHAGGLQSGWGARQVENATSLIARSRTRLG